MASAPTPKTRPRSRKSTQPRAGRRTIPLSCTLPRKPRLRAGPPSFRNRRSA